jgi:hypothetical protein
MCAGGRRSSLRISPGSHMGIVLGHSAVRTTTRPTTAWPFRLISIPYCHVWSSEKKKAVDLKDLFPDHFLHAWYSIILARPTDFSKIVPQKRAHQNVHFSWYKPRCALEQSYHQVDTPSSLAHWHAHQALSRCTTAIFTRARCTKSVRHRLVCSSSCT